MSSFRAALTEVTPRLRERRRKAAWAVVRRVFAALDRVRPHLAAQLAVEIFLTPPRRVHICRCHGSRAAQGHVESEQHQSSWPFEASSVVEVPFRGRMLVGQRVGSGPAVLLVHGWGSTYCQFHALARALVAGGFSVVAFDAPAHGNTAERQADALAFAAAIATAFRKLGPFHAVVAHSFGCIGLAVAMDRYHVRPQRVVLMSAPSSLVWITEDFGAHWGLPRAAARRMRSLLEARSGLAWTDCGIAAILSTLPQPLLLVHDELDAVVPYQHLAKLTTAVGGTTSVTTRGRGHNGVLTDRTVLAKIVAFLLSDEQLSKLSASRGVPSIESRIALA